MVLKKTCTHFIYTLYTLILCQEANWVHGGAIACHNSGKFEEVRSDWHEILLATLRSGKALTRPIFSSMLEILPLTCFSCLMTVFH